MLLAAPRGYCAGVDRAVITVEKALDLYGAPVYVRKQIVHNKHVVAEPGVARRDLRRGARRGARRADRGVLRPRRLARGAPPGRRARAEDHRRDLPAGDQGAPRGEALRRRRLRHPADRARRPRGGRGHRGRGARAHPAGAEPRGRRGDHGARPGQGRLALADHAVGRRDHGDGRGDPASGSRCCSTRRATTSATPPRTASSRSRRSPGSPTW